MEVSAVQFLPSSFPSCVNGRSSKISAVSYSSYSINSWAFKKPLCTQQLSSGLTATQIHHTRKAGLSFASAASSPKSLTSEADASNENWLLEPIGDGDWRHIGVKVQRPGSYEIVSSSLTVGRVPDKADLVIPVATVSGLHARFEKRQGNLYLTDLDSTNGTYVNERRLSPGEVFPVPPGSRVTFGDTHLAIFLVSKIENVGVRDELKEVGGEENAKEESVTDVLQTETAG